MDEKELAQLLERYRQGDCTESERRLVESLHLRAFETDSVPADLTAKRRIWKQLTDNIRPNRTYAMAKRLAVAASVLIVAVLALWFRSANEVPALQALVDIPAGGNKAVLRLADGRVISLDSSQSEIAIHGGRMVYADSSFLGELFLGSEGSKALVDNEIITPRGGMYRVVLEDGTKVWVNAGSTFRFPTRFSHVSREVILIGEAYFEVAHDVNRPFSVTTPGQEIRVLGTAFNVMAYPDGDSEQTTLVEGRVDVSTSGRSRRLNPGEQAVVNDGNLSVDVVDTAPFVAWKSGNFAFNERPLEAIMRDIGRWYAVDVEFQGVDRQLRFGGTVSRYANVSEVLRRLELTGQVRFNIEEGRIVIKP